MQLASRDLAYLRSRTMAVGNALEAAGPPAADAATIEQPFSETYGQSLMH